MAMLKINPPSISVNQCTPQINLPITINAVNKPHKTLMAFLIFVFFIKRWNCIIAVGNTHIASIVVEDGYEASKMPFIKTGRRLITWNSKNTYALKTKM